MVEKSTKRPLLFFCLLPFLLYRFQYLIMYKQDHFSIKVNNIESDCLVFQNIKKNSHHYRNLEYESILVIEAS